MTAHVNSSSRAVLSTTTPVAGCMQSTRHYQVPVYLMWVMCFAERILPLGDSHCTVCTCSKVHHPYGRNRRSDIIHTCVTRATSTGMCCHRGHVHDRCPPEVTISTKQTPTTMTIADTQPLNRPLPCLRTSAVATFVTTPQC